MHALLAGQMLLGLATFLVDHCWGLVQDVLGAEVWCRSQSAFLRLSCCAGRVATLLVLYRCGASMHRYMIVVSRIVVNSDGRSGTAPDSTVKARHVYLMLVCWDVLVFWSSACVAGFLATGATLMSASNKDF